jgi:ribosome-binding protein aMBF1 (putative translation factor)
MQIAQKLYEAGHITYMRTDQTSMSEEAVLQAKKIDSGDINKFKLLTAESRQAMALARSAKKLTQKQLDSLGQFPANSCNGWEAGKTCPTGPQINKLHRLLGVKLERS